MSSFCPIKAQFTTHTMLHIGYVYQNQNFGEVGARFLFLKKDDIIYRISGSALLGAVDKKFVAVPKIQTDILFNFEKNVDFYHSYYFLGSIETTIKYIAPKIGVTLFGLLDVTGGYAFSINGDINGKKMKGLNINFTLNIPIVAVEDTLN